ncbi:thioredoxin family protein [Aureivirga sp. CE67]|uniref:thioredoxin family protein n=1 Tax=Aureivirga sp. CE67 TaxID=1788983 RepID=UPI0018CBECFA|nr:thioredoxin family protein [Aureivirga sp. CE67]
MKQLLQDSIEKAISYEAYKDLVKNLLEQNKTTGPNQTEDLVNYTILNDRRMDRLDKTIKISEETESSLKDINKGQVWLVISEAWCGDAAQNLPILHKISQASDFIDFKVILRDENPQLMDAFLTNGARAIPKMILIDSETLEVINTWGPRPSEATQMVKDYKEKHGALDAEFKKDLQVWYNKNKGKNLQEDILKLMKPVVIE